MNSINRKNKRLLVIASLVVVGMFGFGYAMVPMYNVLCKTLGINGKTGGKTALAHNIDESRTITVQFLATRNSYLPWDFRPKNRTLRVHPGENKLTAFHAKNTTNKTMTVQAIPSVTPGQAAKYLKKTECFCFTRQTMQAGREMDWPLLFHIDAKLPKNIHTITLSYTLFDLTNSDIKPKDGSKLGRIN